MTEDQLNEAIESVRRRGIRGVTREYIEGLGAAGEARVSLSPDFGLVFFTPTMDDMDVHQYAHYVQCGYSDREEFGEGEGSTPGIAAFLAFAEALEVFDLRTTNPH